MNKFILGAVLATTMAMVSAAGAFASGSSAADHCLNDPVACGNDSIIGKSVTVYSIDDGNSYSSIDPFVAQPGDTPITKIYKTSKNPGKIFSHATGSNLD